MNTKLKRILLILPITATLVFGGVGIYKNISKKQKSQAYVLSKKLKRVFNQAKAIAIPEAVAQQDDDMIQEFSGMVRMFLFMMTGYPGVVQGEGYIELSEDQIDLYNEIQDTSCTEAEIVGSGSTECDGPPVAGMLSLYNLVVLGYGEDDFDGILGIINEVIIGNGLTSSANTVDDPSDVSEDDFWISDDWDLDSALTSCEDIPSEGSVRFGADDGNVTIAFSDAVKTVPTGFEDAGETYEKRVEIGFDSSIFVVELNCVEDNELNMYLGFNFAEGSSASRVIEFYADKMDAEDQKFEFFMDYETSSSGAEDQNMALKLNIGEEGAVNYSMLMVNDNDTTFNAFRFSVAGDIDDDDYSIGFQAIQDQSAMTSVSGATGADSTEVDTNLSFSGDDIASDAFLVFCIEGVGTGTYSAPDGVDGSDPSDWDSCTGLDLVEQTGAPAIDPDGDWSLSWAANEGTVTTGFDGKIWSGAESTLENCIWDDSCD